MTQEERIPVSRAVRWRRFRYQAIPLLSFMVAVIATGWLWRNYGGMVQGVGAVDAPRVDITSPTAGLVMSLPHESRGQWLIYDHVQAGEDQPHRVLQRAPLDVDVLGGDAHRSAGSVEFVREVGPQHLEIDRPGEQAQHDGRRQHRCETDDGSHHAHTKPKRPDDQSSLLPR